jgi:cytochrome c553
MKAFIHALAAIVVLVMDALSQPPTSHERPFRASLVRTVVKHPWITAMVLACAVAIGATLVVVSGVVPIKASSGHWAMTAWLLDFAKLRSVSTHSLIIQAPPLDGEALVVRGASHYANGCHSCHGGPGSAVAPVMAAMTPPPPQLRSAAFRYTPEQLFTIVKHGIKFTGMPAWPVQQRDDEVWAVVAFLRRMPGLDAAEYRHLAYGIAGTGADAEPLLPAAGQQSPPQAVRDVCWRCHAVDGTGRGPGMFPSLAGQRAEYLYVSLRAFADRGRHSGIMGGIAANLSDEAMHDIATYYQGLPPRSREHVADQSAIARGLLIASRGVPEQDIPACVECHGPTEQPKNPAYPRLAAQHGPYLASQLELLRSRRRGGSPNVALMHVFVDRLRAQQIHDVTRYYGSIDVRPTQGVLTSPER